MTKMTKSRSDENQIKHSAKSFTNSEINNHVPSKISRKPNGIISSGRKNSSNMDIKEVRSKMMESVSEPDPERIP